jgi:hypothetical protein
MSISSLLHALKRRLLPASAPSPVINISNEFVEWICFANAGMLNRGNLYCFDYAVSRLPSAAPMLEIGSFCGLSTNLLSYYRRKHGVTNPFFSSDRWIFEGATPQGCLGDSDVPHAEYRTHVKESFLRNVRLFSRNDLPRTVEMTSDEFFQAWASGWSGTDVFDRPVQLGGPLSFCYIDGNHSYEFARRDFENTDRFLEPGGFVFFDDSADGSGWDVCRVVAEVARRPDYELVIKNPNYLFRKKR